jgi:hypothetical protein
VRIDHDAGIVDQDVEAAKTFRDESGERPNAACAGHFKPAERDRQLFTAQRLTGSLALCRVAACQNDMYFELPKLAADLVADSAVGAGDYGHTPPLDLHRSRLAAVYTMSSGFTHASNCWAVT